LLQLVTYTRFGRYTVVHTVPTHVATRVYGLRTHPTRLRCVIYTYPRTRPGLRFYLRPLVGLPRWFGFTFITRCPVPVYSLHYPFWLGWFTRLVYLGYGCPATPVLPFTHYGWVYTRVWLLRTPHTRLFYPGHLYTPHGLPFGQHTHCRFTVGWFLTRALVGWDGCPTPARLPVHPTPHAPGYTPVGSLLVLGCTRILHVLAHTFSLHIAPHLFYPTHTHTLLPPCPHDTQVGTPPPPHTHHTHTLHTAASLFMVCHNSHQRHSSPHSSTLALTPLRHSLTDRS